MALAQDQEPSAETLASALTQVLENQQGFQSCFVGNDGERWRLVSIWRTEERFEQFYSSSDRARMAEVLAGAGFEVLEARRMNQVHVIEPRVEELRLIQATVVPSEIERVMEYWRTTGRELNEGADGCVRAQAFMDEDESQLHFAIWWRTAAEASHFRYTDHLDGELARGFGDGFRSFGRYSLSPVKL